VRAEETLATHVRRLVTRRVRLDPSAVKAWLAQDEGSQTLSDEQREAVQAAALSGCFVLTGGPGVGKTTTMRVLIRLLLGLGRSVALAAPTGKAAKRLGEVVGLGASTVHRLLGAGPAGFRHGSREPLRADVVVVDEASMLDTQLGRASSRRASERRATGELARLRAAQPVRAASDDSRSRRRLFRVRASRVGRGFADHGQDGRAVEHFRTAVDYNVALRHWPAAVLSRVQLGQALPRTRWCAGVGAAIGRSTWATARPPRSAARLSAVGEAGPQRFPPCVRPGTA